MGDFARRLVASQGGRRRTVTLRGYHAVELSGRVSGVRYDQSRLATVVEIDGHAATRPSLSGAVGGGLGGLGGGGFGSGGGRQLVGGGLGVSDDPRPTRQPHRGHAAAAARTESAAQAGGEARGGGSRQRRQQGPPAPPERPAWVAVKIATAPADAAGRYGANVLLPPSPRPPAVGKLTVAGLGTVGPACVVEHYPDAGGDKQSLEVGKVYWGWVIGRARAAAGADLGLLVASFGGGGGGVLLPVSGVLGQVLTRTGFGYDWDYVRAV